jgi:hypothetical protein
VDQQRRARTVTQLPGTDDVRIEGLEGSGGHACEYMDRPRDAQCYRRPPWARR